MGARPLTILIAATLSFALACPIIAQGGTKGEKPMPKPPMNMETVRSVSPALERYTTGQLVGEVWMRSDLSPRDRSVATVAAAAATRASSHVDIFSASQPPISRTSGLDGGRRTCR